MRRIRPGVAAIAIVPALFVTSCGGAVEDAPHVVENAPASIETIEGSDLVRVTLTERAAERIDVRTTTVGRAPGGLVVPSTAVFVDTEGVWWVYTSPEPLVFVRHEIGLESQDSGHAFLSSGPPVGTEIVTVGVAELAGSEEEIGH